MLVAVALSALLAMAGPVLLVGPVRPALVAVPPEPGAAVLTDAPTAQAVAVDLDRDGRRDVLAVTEGRDRGLRIEAWSEDGGAWTPIGSPLPVALPEPPAAPPDVDTVTLRLLVHRTAGATRAILLTQPPADVRDDLCCLTLDEVRVEDGSLALAPAADPIEAVDAVHVIDLNGDGTDELVGTRSLPQLGDISYPTRTVVLRWEGSRFGPPAIGELPVGSGDTPFPLGDSDERPGEELGIIATIGRPAFYRIGLDDDGALRVEDARLLPLPDAVIAVPVGDGRGIATLNGSGTVEVRSWPSDQPPGDAVGHTTGFGGGRLLGTVTAADLPHLVVRQAVGVELLHLLELPTLRPIVSGAPRGGAAPAFSRVAPVVSYAGPVPGGGPDGGPAFLAAGRLVTSTDGAPGSLWRRTGLLPGAAPVGLAGSDRAWLAIHHLPMGIPPGPGGGRLDPPLLMPGSGLTVAPLALAGQPEVDDATLEPEVAGRAVVGADGTLSVGAAGFVAIVDAPPGSRIYTSALDPTVVASITVVDGGGRAEVRMPPPTTGTPEPRYRAALAVTTPAGHGYLATWTVRVLTEPPRLEASVSTPLGSSDVVVEGTTASGAEIRVAGRSVAVAGDGRFETTVAVPPWPTEVVVTATDALGNESRRVLTAIGILDVRQLPWIPIAGLVVGAVALLLALRVPRARPVAASGREEDEVVLEELDPDA